LFHSLRSLNWLKPFVDFTLSGKNLPVVRDPLPGFDLCLFVHVFLYHIFTEVQNRKQPLVSMPKYRV
jgi:hypothetical protein